jgi:hypothetical protein
MKYALILIIALSDICFAGGSGSGTLLQLPTSSITNSGRLLQNGPVDIKFGDIIYYKGETATDLFLQFGKIQGNNWDIKGIKLKKDTTFIDNALFDAIVNSKTSNDWSKIVPFNPYKE